MNTLHQTPYRCCRSRRGAVVICALVCLAVVAAMLAALVKTTLLTQRQLRVESFATQADWCADAGCARAARRLSGEAVYAGEIWDVLPDPDRSPRIARVEIVVERRGDGEATAVSVLAEYPFGDPRSVRRRRSN